MPDSVVTRLAALFRADLDAKNNEAVGQMASEWLKIELRLEKEIQLLATELAAPPGGVKLDPITDMVVKMKAAGYDPDYIQKILMTQGILHIPDVPKPQAKELKAWQLARLQRYVRLLEQVRQEFEKYTGQTARPIIETLKNDAALSGIQQALTMIDATISSAGGSAVDLTFDRLGIEAVQNITAIAGAGKPLGDLLQAAYPLAANGITNELLYGTAIGRNPRETARKIIADGLSQGLNHMLLVARDQQIRAYREGSRQSYLKAGIPQYRRLAAKQSRTCFLAGTKIKTNIGDLYIEDVQPGMQALTRKGYRMVVGRMEQLYHGCFVSLIHGDAKRERQIIATSDHLLWVESANEWRKIKDIFIGEKLLTLAGESTVRAVQYFQTRDTVYNLEVEGEHEYFADGVLVHNCLACLALDGSIWDVAELMPLHPEDRCSQIPIVPGFEPAQFETGREWFERQPEEVQKQMMGPGRFAAWKAGKFDFDQLVTVKPNKTWGPSAQVTPLKDLLKGRGGLPRPRPSLPPRPPKPQPPFPSLPLTGPGPSPLPALDHDALLELDLHKVGPKWGEQDNWHNQSYGGVIFDENGRVLLRKPTGDFDGYAWTFPKGRMDSPDEHPVITALREVEQETGHNCEIIGLVPGQFQAGPGSTKNNFFLMKSTGFDKSKMDWETEDLVWADFVEVQKLIGQGTNKAGIQRDWEILNAAIKAHQALLDGTATNDYLFKKPKPAVITSFAPALTADLKKQATGTAVNAALASIEHDGKGIAVLDGAGKLKAILSYDDTEDKHLHITAASGLNTTAAKTALINAGKLAAKQGKGVFVKTNPDITKALKSLGFEPGGPGKPFPAGTYYLPPEWMGTWKKAPTKFAKNKPPLPTAPLPPEPREYNRSSYAPGSPLTGLYDHVKKFISDPLALKGIQTAIDKIKGGQQGLAYGKLSEFSGLITWEEQASIIKVGSAGFANFDVNLLALKDVVKIAKAAGKDFVTFAPKGKILDQYKKWGFEVNQDYANGASLILKKGEFDLWLKNPVEYGARKPAPSTGPSTGSGGASGSSPASTSTPSTSYAPPPSPASSFRATPKSRPPEPVPLSVPLPEPPDFPDDPTALKLVRRLGGSTGAELVEDITGRRYVRKKGSSADHVIEECHADAAYAAAGANVPRFRLYWINGEPIKLAEFIEGDSLKDALARGGAKAKKIRQEVQKLFAADALFSNRDVIGLDYDNILVDKAGIVWRIDNGGSFRYRAQGARKQDWDEYATDLWTLRDKKINAQTGDVFGDLDFYAISDQVLDLQVRRQTILQAVPDEVQDVLARRLDHAVDMARTAKAMQPDNFKVEYADEFSRQRMELRRGGLAEQMPRAFDIQGYENATASQRYTGDGVNTSAVYDEEGRKFDRLRGKNSLVMQFRDFVHKLGGDYSLIVDWAGAQAGSSWSGRAQALKYHIVENWLKKPADLFWWAKGKAQAKAKYQKYATNPAVYDRTFLALHVFTQELLHKMDFPNKTDRGTVVLFRTEDYNVLLGKHGLKPGQRNVTMPRGPVESMSIFDAVYIGTTELTRQEVPLHRVIATYFMERNPGYGGDLLLGDHENEFVAILGGDVPFDYVASNHGRTIAIAP